MKRTEVVKLNNNLEKVKGLVGVELNYAIKKNLKSLKAELEIYAEEENEITSLADDFNKERTELQEKYATVDGEVKTKELENKTKVYDISPENMKKIELELIILNKKYSEVFKEIESKWNALMNVRANTESDFVIYQVDKNDLPKDISTEDMDLIFELIK